MVVRIQDIRRPTLQATYVELEKLIQDGKNGKLDLKLLASTTDGDYFDESVRLIIIDKIRIHDEVAKKLYSTDPGVVRRLVKCFWFFKDTPNSYFIDNVFPVVSVSTRLKVISSLGKIVDETRAEQLYCYLSKTYGHRCAEPVFAKCTEPTIRKRIFEDRCVTGDRAFVIISRRFPQLGIDAIKFWLQRGKTISPSVGKDLVNRTPQYLSQLSYSQMKSAQFKFGRKLLRSLMKIHREMFEKCGFKSSELFSCPRRLFLKLGDEAQTTYLIDMIRKSDIRITKNNWLNSLPEVREILKSLPATKREFLLHNVFQIIYSEDLWNTPLAWSDKLLEIITKERRAILLQHEKFQKDSFIYLKPAAEAVPLLIEKVRRTPDPANRIRLVTDMIKCVRLDINLDLLLQTCEFVCKHLSQDGDALLIFLEAVATNFPNGALSEQIWVQLSKITSSAVASGLNKMGMLYTHEGLVGSILARGGVVADAANAWKKDVLATYHPIDRFFQRPFFPNAKLTLKCFYNYLPDIVIAVSKYVGYIFLLDFLQFAKVVKLNFAELPDRGASFCDLLDKVAIDDFCVDDLVYGIWRQPAISYRSPIMVRLYVRSKILVHVFQKQPFYVLDNFKEIIEEMFSYYYTKSQTHFLQSRRLIQFYGITDEIANICEQEFEQTDIASRINVILAVYSNVVSKKKFCQLAARFISNDSRLDPKYETASIQRMIPTLCRFLRPLQDTATLVIPCLEGGGDFLYPALPTFQKICYTLHGSFVKEVCLPLLMKPVSVKKKVLRILCDVLTSEESCELFFESWLRAKHYSERQILLASISHCFFDNPRREVWDFLRKSISEINDHLLIPALPDLDVLPDDYVAEYVIIVWKILVDLEKCQGVETAVFSFLSDCSARIQLLSDETCKKIICHFLFTENSIGVDFSVKYLFNGNADLSIRLNFLLSLFHERAHKNLNSLDVFINSLLDHRAHEGFYPVFTEFQKYFKNEIIGMKFFGPRLQLDLVDLSQPAWIGNEYERCLLPAVGRSIGEYWCTFHHLELLLPLVTDSLLQFFEKDDLPAVLLGLVNENPILCVAALHILPHCNFNTASTEIQTIITYMKDSWTVQSLDNLAHSCNDSTKNLYLSNFLTFFNDASIVEGNLVRSCSLSRDFGTVGLVCKHVVNHHRNDEWVHDAFLEEVAKLVSQRGSVTVTTWEAISDVAALRANSCSTPLLGRIFLQHANFLISQNFDPTKLLECWLAEGWKIVVREMPAKLKEYAIPVIQRLLSSPYIKDYTAVFLLRILIEENVDNLKEIIQTVFDKVDFETTFHFLSDHILRTFSNNSIASQFLPVIFSQITLNEFHIFWFWRNQPRIICDEIERIVHYLIQKVSFHDATDALLFLQNRRLTHFFGLCPKIKEIALEEWNDSAVHQRTHILTLLAKTSSVTQFLKLYDQLTKNISDSTELEKWMQHLLKFGEFNPSAILTKLTAESFLKTFYMRLPQENVLHLFTSIAHEKCCVHALSVTSPLSDVVQLLVKHKDTMSGGEIATSLRFLLRNVLEDRSARNWELVDEFFQKCPAKHIRKLQGYFKILPVEHLGDFASLGWLHGHWGSSEVTPRCLKNLLSAISERELGYFPKPLRVEMFKMANENHIKFIYSLLSATDLREELMKKINNKNFTVKLCQFVLDETAKLDVGENMALSMMVSCKQELLVLGFVEQFYTVELCQLWLHSRSNPEQFPNCVFDLIRTIPDLELRFTFIVGALKKVLNVLSNEQKTFTVFDFLEKSLPLVENQTELVIVALLLPVNVPSSGPLVLDPGAVAYQNVLSWLERKNDALVDAYFYRHMAKRILY